MADVKTRRVDHHAVLRAVGAATQWRLLLLWVGTLLIPTAVVSLPLWSALGGVLNHSVHAQAWASGFDALAFGDTMAALRPASAALGGSALVALALTLLLSPFLNGMVVGSALAGRVLGFGHLLQCGVVEYARMFRLLLWSILAYAVVAIVAGAASGAASKFAGRALLESSADHASQWTLAALVVLWVVAQMVLDGARAAFMADAGLRSATRAFGRGWLLLLRRPLSVLAYFVGISVIGYAVALALGLLRISMDRGSVIGLVVVVLLTQLIVLAIGWVHIARMYALSTIVRTLPVRRKVEKAVPPAIPAGA